MVRSYRHCVRRSRQGIQIGGHSQLGRDDPQLRSVYADIHDERSVADAHAGAYAVVNTVSLYVEHGQETFDSLHVESAQRAAAQAHRAGVKRLVHIQESAPIPRLNHGTSERAVKVNSWSGLLLSTYVSSDLPSCSDRTMRFSPPFSSFSAGSQSNPTFGRGLMRLQRAYVEDMAEAIVRIERAEAQPGIFECSGPRVYSYEEFVGIVARQAGLAPILIPIPFAVWHALAWASEILPAPLLTRNQVELMEIDTVSSPEMPPDLIFDRHRGQARLVVPYER
jgi:uncharacterized protein YbjT (DUF2867 family)